MKTQGGPKVEERLDVIADDLTSNPEAGWSKVFVPALRRALWVGVGLAVFQQVTGINAVIYYSDKIFALAGFTTPEQQTHATLIAVGLVNVLATLIAVAWVDRFGRKPLLFAGLIGMTVGLVSIAGAFAFLDKNPTEGGGSSVVGIVTLIAMVVYIASFAFSLGPVVWTMISEIFPSQVRGKAVAVCAAVNWGAAFVVSVTFLSLIDAIGEVRDVPPVRRDVRDRLRVDHVQGARDEGEVTGGDPGRLGRARRERGARPRIRRSRSIWPERSRQHERKREVRA